MRQRVPRGLGKGPSHLSPAASQFEQAVYRNPLIAQIRELHEFRAVARIPGDRKFVIYNAHRYTLPAKAANNAQSLVVAADDNRSDGAVHSTARCWASGRVESRHSWRQLLPFLRVMERTNSFEANSAPETKPSSGPKLHAAGLPRKCNPGIEDSSPRLSTGKPFTVFSCFDNDGDRNGYRETSTRNPVARSA